MMSKTDAVSGQPTRILQFWAAVAIVVGIVVGAGIFKTPSMVAGLTGDAGWLLAVWIGGAMISLAGALCYAELCSAHPHAGGDYHFLSKAYGKNLSFLYAWAKAMVINTGSIALLAYVFGDYMSKVVALGPYSSALWAVAIVVLLTLTNILGLRNSSRLQTVLIVLVLSDSARWCGPDFLRPRRRDRRGNFSRAARRPVSWVWPWFLSC